MTVREEAKAKEVLNNIWDFADAQDEEKGDVVDDAIIEAIGCMEEVEQYRAIGLRPEQIEVMQGHNIALINELEGYQSLGTVEQQKEAREKQIPKKPTDFCIKDVGSCRRVDLICPTCNNAIVGQPYKPNYCKHCGQALKWGAR